MKILVRAVLPVAVAAFLLAPSPAAAEPSSNLYKNHVQVLTDLADAETDAARKAALLQAIALFDNTSNSLAADLVDAANAVKKLEAAYGTSGAQVHDVLDGNVAGAFLAAFTRSNQAYVGAQQKLLAAGNLGAITRLAKVHLGQVKKYQKAFPETPDPSISRVRKLKALVALEKYGANLAKRHRIELNQF